MSRPDLGSYVGVSYAQLARLDAVPCDIFVSAGARKTLYASTGIDPAILRGKAAAGVPLYVREGDQDALRRTLPMSLSRTFADKSLTPADRSRQAYEMTAAVVAGTLKMHGRFDRDEASLVGETVDTLTKVLAQDDEQLWGMVASMQRNLSVHHHAINSALYALALGKASGVSDEARLGDIGRGALLMDIGLTTIPVETLNKAEGLKDYERDAIRRHPDNGAKIVSRASITGETPSYARTIREHHERLDGSGFPRGLKGGEIGDDSRIVAIVDAFGMLTSERPGISAKSAFEALQDMRFNQRGQFDDGYLAPFVKLLGGWEVMKYRGSGAA